MINRVFPVCRHLGLDGIFDEICRLSRAIGVRDVDIQHHESQDGKKKRQNGILDDEGPTKYRQRDRDNCVPGRNTLQYFGS